MIFEYFTADGGTEYVDQFGIRFPFLENDYSELRDLANANRGHGIANYVYFLNKEDREAFVLIAKLKGLL